MTLSDGQCVPDAVQSAKRLVPILMMRGGEVILHSKWALPNFDVIKALVDCL